MWQSENLTQWDYDCLLVSYFHLFYLFLSFSLPNIFLFWKLTFNCQHRWLPNAYCALIVTYSSMWVSNANWWCKSLFFSPIFSISFFSLIFSNHSTSTDPTMAVLAGIIVKSVVTITHIHWIVIKGIKVAGSIREQASQELQPDILVDKLISILPGGSNNANYLLLAHNLFFTSLLTTTT